VVAVELAGVNFPDTLIVQGRYQVRPEPPFSPGFEALGRIVAVGGDVDLEVGTRVIGTGGHGAFAEQWVLPASQLAPIPDWVDSELAAGFGLTYGTVLYALEQRADLREGEDLLVLGAAGGIGSAAVDLGKALGARVIAAASADDKLEFLRDLGADDTINYEQVDLGEIVNTLTNGKGADVVCDPVGGQYTEAAVRATAWEGRLLVVGFAAGDIPQIPLNLPLLKGMSLVGVYWGSWVAREPAAAAANFTRLVAMLEAGRIHPRIHGVYDLTDFAAALDLITSRRVQGKVLLRIGG
jgi:NADPH:quinone reductase-like Zn-dependent oxidoreductase